MRLLRCLFVRAAWQIEIHATHIPGLTNVLADAILHNNLSLVFLKVPQVDPSAGPDAGVGGREAAGLVVAQLAPVVQDLFTAGIVQSTQRTYRSGRRGTFIFATEQGLTLFAAHLFKRVL